MRRAWLLQMRNQGLGFVREPAAFVFNLLVPLFIVLVEAFAFGTTELGSQLPGYRVVDTLPSLALVMFVMIIGLFGMSVGLSSMMESRTLAGASLRPGGVGLVLTAYAAVLLLLTILGLAISIGILALGWQIVAPAHPWALLPVVLLASAAFLLFGACRAGLTGSPRAAQGVCSAIFFPFLFLSGAVFQLSSFPEALQTVARVLPGYHVYEVVAALWIVDQPVPTASLAYLVGFLVVSMAATGWVFRRREGV